MSAPSELRLAAIRQQCTQLHLPAVGAQCARLAAEAATAQQDHLTYLEALLGAEVDERACRLIDRRIQEAHFPMLKSLEEFAFAEAPTISATTIRSLAEGDYLARAEPVLFLGEPGTGKTHLAIGLAVAACRQRRRVRFTTAAALVKDLVEGQHQQQLSRVINRWARVELIVIDELAYVAVADLGAELLFQLIAERAEKQFHLRRDQLVLSSSHTHCGPVIGKMLGTMYPMNPQQWADVDAYTSELEDKIVKLVGASLKSLRPAHLSFGHGEASFAMNRRGRTNEGMVIGVNKEGPVDHDVPVLRVDDQQGKLRAVVFGYACHNTTARDFLQFHGDYAGFA